MKCNRAVSHEEDSLSADQMLPVAFAEVSDDPVSKPVVNFGGIGLQLLRRRRAV